MTCPLGLTIVAQNRWKAFHGLTGQAWAQLELDSAAGIRHIKAAMRTILHIGSTKTGSSALQVALCEHRDALAAAGVHYPVRGVAASAQHLLAAAIHPGAWRMHAGELPEDRSAYFDETVAAIRTDIEDAGAHTLVLSTEYFWGVFAPDLYKRFAAAFAPTDYELVAFVREPVAWVTSSYLQAVKSGESRSLDEWFGLALDRWNSGIHAFRVINRWNYFLNARRVHVLRYETTKANVYAAFCERLGIDVPTDVPMRRVNPSPSPEGVKQLLAINRTDLPHEDKVQQRKAIMREHAGSGSMEELVSPQLRERILTLSGQSERLLEAEFAIPPAPAPPTPDALESMPSAPAGG